MTRVFAADLKLYCISAICVVALAQVFIAARLRLDVIRAEKALSGYQIGRNYGLRQIFGMHKLLFKGSWTRRLLLISVGIQLVALMPYLVLTLNDTSFVDNNLLHLISRGR
jgi:hypothetical protein